MGLSISTRRLAKPGETDDFRGGRPPVFGAAMDLDSYLRHLEDAKPSIVAEGDGGEGDPPARYVIGGELGSGSVGQVIEAEDRHLGRRVAIKIIHEGEGLSRDGIARFMAEAQITAQLEHPMVVPVHEIGIMPDGMPYFSMKLVKGESLEDLINLLRIGDRTMTGRYGFARRLRIFAHLCQGMAYAHSKGVVHRDLKPSNILMGEYGEIQIMDWGLAKAAFTQRPGQQVVTVRRVSIPGARDVSIAGTPAYMSPEQAAGGFETLSPASDVFSLGLMLAELLTLFRVNRADTYNAALERAREAEAVDLRLLAPDADVPAGARMVVEKATRRNPDDRYPDAGAMAEDIIGIIEDMAPSPARRNGAGGSAFPAGFRAGVVSGMALGALAAALALTMLALVAWEVFS